MRREAAIEALDAGDTSAARLASYRAKLEDSFVLKDLQAYRRFPAFMEGTPRMFSGYPEMAADIMRGMFSVDGAPVRSVKSTVMGPVKRMGMLSLLKDARRGMKAL